MDCIVQFSSVQSLSRVRLFVTPWTAACQSSLSITNSQSLLKLLSIESVMHIMVSHCDFNLHIPLVNAGGISICILIFQLTPSSVKCLFMSSCSFMESFD